MIVLSFLSSLNKKTNQDKKPIGNRRILNAKHHKNLVDFFMFRLYKFFKNLSTCALTFLSINAQMTPKEDLCKYFN